MHFCVQPLVLASLVGCCVPPPAAQEAMMYHQVACMCSLLLSLAAATTQYIAFDTASASSTYSAGNLAGSPAFAAQQALTGGSGYWCVMGLCRGSDGALPSRFACVVLSAICHCNCSHKSASTFLFRPHIPPWIWSRARHRRLLLLACTFGSAM